MFGFLNGGTDSVNLAEENHLGEEVLVVDSL